MSTTGNSSNTTTANKPVSSSNKDDEFNAFVSEKDQLLYSYEDNLSNHSWKEVRLNPVYI
ncbi:MAG: hypothetical protein HC831_14085 [Chloroflexia bacterium]|nr:hypothetical protein [Chloroflexia bacterium]